MCHAAALRAHHHGGSCKEQLLPTTAVKPMGAGEFHLRLCNREVLQADGALPGRRPEDRGRHGHAGWDGAQCSCNCLRRTRLKRILCRRRCCCWCNVSLPQRPRGGEHRDHILLRANCRSNQWCTIRLFVSPGQHSRIRWWSTCWSRLSGMLDHAVGIELGPTGAQVHLRRVHRLPPREHLRGQAWWDRRRR